jgi:hypothetical protein
LKTEAVIVISKQFDVNTIISDLMDIAESKNLDQSTRMIYNGRLMGAVKRHSKKNPDVMFRIFKLVTQETFNMRCVIVNGQVSSYQEHIKKGQSQ